MLKYSSKDIDFLFRFFDHFLKLDREEEERLIDEMQQTGEWEEVKGLLISYIERGKKYAQEEIAFELSKEGMDIDFISKVTKLTEEQIKGLMNETKQTGERDVIKELPISYIELGKEYGREGIAVELQKEGIEINFISKLTKLTEERIKELMNEKKQTDDWEEIKKLPISWEEKGIEKGIEKGVEKNQEETAVKLIEEGMGISFIQKITELSEERIKELMENQSEK